MKKLLRVMLVVVLMVGLANAQSITASSFPLQDQVAVVRHQTIDLQNPGPILEQIQEEDPIKAKKISKVFPVSNADRVVLNNQYGTMEIKTWTKKEVKIDVDIKIYGSNASEAQELMDLVALDLVKRNGEVILDTKLTNGKGRNGKKWRTEVKINYLVYMPEGNNLDLSHEYGNVTMGDLSGALDATIQYGNFTAGNLKSTKNNISVNYGRSTIAGINKAEIVQQYGAGISIGTVETLDLDAAYAAVQISNITGKGIIVQQYGPGLTIGTVQHLDLDASYAAVNIGAITGAAKIVQQYSNLSINTANMINADAQYANITIGSLKGNGTFSMQYNALTVGDVTSGCKLLDIDGAYLKTALKFNEGYHGILDVETSNTSFKSGSRVMVKSNGDAQSKVYTGKIGSGGNSRVKISSSYGAILIN